MKIRKDKYLRERGGKAKFISVCCTQCAKLVFNYQKDGPGLLKRCYLNRIINSKYANLDKKIKDIKDLSNLVCECGSVLGSPMRYKDGRLAFHLVRGKFKRGNLKNR